MLGFSAFKILILGIALVAVCFFLSLGRHQGQHQGWSMAESLRKMRRKTQDMRSPPLKTTRLNQCAVCKTYHDHRKPCNCGMSKY